MADNNAYEVRYVGPFGDGVEVDGQTVRNGETVHVDEETAARLLEGEGAFELVGGPKKKPKAAPSGESVESVTPSPTDVHEQPPVAADEPPPGGTDKE